MKRMNFVIACLRPSQNMKLGIFTGSRAVDGKKKMRKKSVMLMESCCVVFVAAASLTCYYLLYIVTRQKQNILLGKLNCSCCMIASQNFFPLIGISFVPVRKVENKIFPCSHKLGERTGRVQQDNSGRVRAYEKNSGETVRRLGTIMQSIFCAQSVTGIRLNLWK